MRAALLVAALVALAGSALAEERVLYCTETDSAGFKWEEGQTEGRVTRFIANRYIVRVLSETTRVITPTTGPEKGSPDGLTCSTPLPSVFPERFWCISRLGTAPWLFNGNNFVHAFMLGTPVAGDPSIWVSYGTCTEF